MIAVDPKPYKELKRQQVKLCMVEVICHDCAVRVQNGNGLRELQQGPCYVPEDLDFSKEDARHLPPWHLYSTEADITVPW